MPLFKRGVERERFDCAISWLKKAIQQLLLTRGDGFDSFAFLLPPFSYCYALSLDKLSEQPR